MSDPSEKKSPLTRRGEWPSSTSGDVGPLGSAVTGFIEARREAVGLDIGGINVDQLALALAERMRAPEVERPMLGELADEWFQAIAPLRVCPAGEATLLTHLRPLFLDDEASLTVGAITELLEQLLRAGYSPSTVNKVRGTGKRVVDHAAASKRWTGPNPFALSRRKREPERQYELLSLEELERVQRKLPSHRRQMFRVALHLGLRTGELLSLRREDVDFDLGTVRIHRSHGRDQTKTGRERTIPLHPACAGDLLEASLASSSDIIFAAEGGELQRQDTKLTRVLRTAMASAGVAITSVTYKCRRRGCEANDETHEEDAVRKLDCMRCEMRLWPVPEVRPVRWYDLRHIATTLHHQHRADEVCIARALGHAIKDTTRRIYTHVDMDEMRRELTKWRLP